MSIYHILNLSQKKRVLSPYISASEFENFMKNDTVCDWLSIVLPKKIEPHPLQYLFNKGIHYESQVIDYLSKKLKIALPKLSSVNTSRDYTSYEHDIDCKISMDSMRKGIPLLYSPYLVSEKQKLRGIPDLLIRSDYIESYFGIEVPQEKSNFGSYYYIPIEIKYSSLHFDKTNQTLLNMNRTKIYKNQLYVYSSILSDIQGVLPCCSFIIGKNYMKDNQLGHVYYETRDKEIVSLFQKGFEWLQHVKKNSHKWKFEKTEEILHILPNMKVSHSIYDPEKKIISEHIGEITDFWQCGIKQRYNLLDKTNDQIYSWKNPEFDVSLLGINKSYLEKVDKLLKINRGEIEPIYPKKIKHNLFEWRNQSNEIFVDFETIYNEEEDGEMMIFLIGVYHQNQYTYFVANNMNPSSEKEILLSFYQFWKDLGEPKIWYWFAEDMFWKKSCKKYDLSFVLSWIDLYKVFYEGEVFVKGCKNFKLKSYVYSLLKMEEIQIDLHINLELLLVLLVLISLY